MNTKQLSVLLPALLCFWCIATPATESAELKGTLSDNQRINSDILDYSLHYRVYLPPSHELLSNLPSIYITDGQWYLDQGNMAKVIDTEIARGKIRPVVAVFIDNRDPDHLADIRRNREFFCNRQYADFFRLELLPAIDNQYKTQAHRDHRVILGVSFGGLNAACFALMANDSFTGIAMHSPAIRPVTNLFDLFRQMPKQPLRFFLSTGTVNDNVESARRFYALLNELDYDVKYRQVREGHNWRNWRPLIDDVLVYFFPPQS